jgi:type III restriction enzyme
MLEFTATVDLKHPEVAKKYDDKILYDYSLKQFRKDGFSKDVNVLAADMTPIDRTFQAVVLSQYRRKLAEEDAARRAAEAAAAQRAQTIQNWFK